MNAVITLFTAFLYNLPWLAIGLLAALARRKRHNSRPLMFQTFGAAATLTLAFTRRLLIDVIMTGLNIRTSISSGTHYIFDFLTFLALATFALGYCLEHFSSKIVDVSATPVS